MQHTAHVSVPPTLNFISCPDLQVSRLTQPLVPVTSVLNVSTLTLTQGALAPAPQSGPEQPSSSSLLLKPDARWSFRRGRRHFPRDLNRPPCPCCPSSGLGHRAAPAGPPTSPRPPWIRRGDGRHGVIEHRSKALLITCRSSVSSRASLTCSQLLGWSAVSLSSLNLPFPPSLSLEHSFPVASCHPSGPGCNAVCFSDLCRVAAAVSFLVEPFVYFFHSSCHSLGLFCVYSLASLVHLAL